MIIVFDIESNGLPKNWKENYKNVGNWPRIIQLAWQQYTPEGKKIAEHNYLIKPDGFELDKHAQEVNKITKEMLDKDGIAINHALEMFIKSLSITTKIVAHNISFDQNVLLSELIRADKNEATNLFLEKERLCTMHKSTQFCGIPGAYGFKWPKLEELHQRLFGEPVENAHDALGDVSATAKCYFKLVEKNII